MSATPTEEQIQDAQTAAPEEISADVDAASSSVEAAFEAEDLSTEDVPSADDPSSRANPRNLDDAGFTIDEFAALLSKYDYNFKPGDIVNGTVFALESKGAMIDIGAKTVLFMPLQEVRSTGEGLSDVLQPGEIRGFFIMSEENEDGQLVSFENRVPASLGTGASASERRRDHLL